MSKKVTIIIVVAVVALIAWGIRVYQVNDGVALAYETKTYQIGDQISIDNATLKVTNVKQGEVTEKEGFKSFPVTVEMQIQNTTDEEISVHGLIPTKLVYGGYGYDYQTGDFEGTDALRSLAPDATATFLLIYHIDPDDQNKKGKMYFDQRLYQQLVTEQYQEGKRYGIVVDLP